MRSVLVLVLLATSMSVSAASKPKAHPAAPKKATVPDVEFLKTPFDDSLSTLPPRFVGNYFPDVYLEHAIDRKGEYETSAQFEARKAAVPAATYAFLLKDVTPRYDADQGAFSFSVRFDYSRDYIGTFSNAPIVTSVLNVETERRRYKAANALGATTTVEHVTSKEFQIAATRFRYPETVEFAVPVPPTDAPQMKPRLGVLLVCRTRPELALIRSEFGDGSTGYHHVNATFDAPTEYSTSYFTLSTDLVGFWVYDLLTGRIVEKFDGYGKTTKIPLLSN